MNSSFNIGRRGLVLVAMIFAVAMSFIDQTIVAIALPNVQHDLGLSSTGAQWIVNAYLLSLAALFAFGGKLADIFGHRRVTEVGVVIFAFASAMCGLTPHGKLAEAWLIGFRVLQGAGGAILYPAALAIVVDTFPTRQRGRALAIFFAVAGGLTAVGPLAGGYLTELTWRAIFWVNVPVALIALVLITLARPTNERRAGRIDLRGLLLLGSGIALSVFGFQQSGSWGWHSASVWTCIVAGAALMLAFVANQQRARNPLVDIGLFRNRVFAVESLIVGLVSLVFVPTFVIASEYAQVSLGDSPSSAGVFLLYLFIGFVIAAQLGGKMLDAGKPKKPVVLGCAMSAVGFYLWSQNVHQLTFSAQQWYVVLAGAGIGMMFGPATSNALSRVGRDSYGSASGVIQTIRNYAGALGLAVLSSLLLTRLHDPVISAEPLRNGFASATSDVLVVMAVIMAVAAVAAKLWLPGGAADTPSADGTDVARADELGFTHEREEDRELVIH
jgi:EmrB/QacA subfamily drug resistance transporter